MLRRCLKSLYLKEWPSRQHWTCSDLVSSPSQTAEFLDKKLFILVVFTRLLWFPSLCTGYVELVLVGEPRTPLPKSSTLVTSCWHSCGTQAPLQAASRTPPVVTRSSGTCPAVRCFLVSSRATPRGATLPSALPFCVQSRYTSTQ